MVSRFDNSTDMASQIRRDLRLRLEEAERFHRDDWDSSRAINESQIEQLSIYIEFLEKWTRKVDLVSQKSGLDMVIPHIVDSVVGLVVALSLVKSSGFDSDLELDSTTLCDVGSGAGLPGLVWAILRPELSVVLLEPRKRRVDFLTEVRRVLELGNVSLLAKRMQEAEATDIGGKKSLLFVCRALGMEETYLGFCQRISTEGAMAGSALIMAGPNWSCPSEVDSKFGLPIETRQYALLSEGPQRMMLAWDVSRGTAANN